MPGAADEPSAAQPTAETTADPQPVTPLQTSPAVVAEDEGSTVPAWLLIVVAAVGLTAVGAIGRTVRIRRREAELFAQLEEIADEPQLTVILEEQPLVRSGDSPQN